MVLNKVHIRTAILYNSNRYNNYITIKNNKYINLHTINSLMTYNYYINDYICKFIITNYSY